MKKLKGLLCDVIKCENREEWLEARKPLLTASDVAAALGASPWKTPLQLWQEKTGLVEVPDISDKPAVKRGIEREPIIRKRFAKEHQFLLVDYHATDIYVCKEPGKEMLAATLDGELTVLDDNNPLHLPKGSRGVLEIKTKGYKYPSDLSEWAEGGIPVGYRKQILQQMYVTQSWFVIIVPEFQYMGDDPQMEEFTLGEPRMLCAGDPEVKAEMLQQADDASEWWMYYVIQKQTPPTVLQTETEECVEVAVIEADAEIGRFNENFAEVAKTIRRMVEPYKNAVFTPDTAKDAKEIHAKLNSLAKDIDAKRVAVAKKYKAPLDAFEKKAKQLRAIIDDVRNPIKEQLDAFEVKRKEEKKQEILSLADAIASDRFVDEVQLAYWNSCGGASFDERWLNKTVKMAEVEEAIDGQICMFIDDFKALTEYGKDDPGLADMLFAEYAKSRSLSQCMQAKTRFEHARATAARIQAESLAREAEAKARAEAEAKARAEAEAKAKAEAEAMQKANAEFEEKVNAGAVKIDTTVQAVMPEAPQMITYTFRASHTSRDVWRGLVQYMKDNGFDYEKLN